MTGGVFIEYKGTTDLSGVLVAKWPTQKQSRGLAPGVSHPAHRASEGRETSVAGVQQGGDFTFRYVFTSGGNLLPCGRKQKAACGVAAVKRIVNDRGLSRRVQTHGQQTTDCR
jgi:hypothetical protein